MKIRSFFTTEATALESLIRSVMPRPWTLEAIQSALSAAAARTRVAEQPEGAVGFVVGRRILDELEIDLVGVLPAARRSGVARALLQDLIAAEREEGLARVHLELAASNAAALGLYQELGFVVVGRRERYYPGGEAALLLTLDSVELR